MPHGGFLALIEPFAGECAVRVAKWPTPALNNTKPNFTDVEKKVGLDHWRPRYKWASQDTHANHRPTPAMLALCEKDYEGLAFPAESNSGMTDPAQMMALSLTLITAAHMQTKPNIDRSIALKAMELLNDEIGETFMGIEAKSLAKARKKPRP